MSDECGNCELCTFTVERFETYYFDSYATDGLRPGWHWWPEDMVDGRLDAHAQTKTHQEIQWLDTNTATAKIGTTITKVEIRAYSICEDACGTVTQHLRTIFIAGVGDEHLYEPPGNIMSGSVVPSWSQWFDITSDTNAPGTWTWADVIALDLDTWMDKTLCAEPPDFINCYKVEIRVTWTESIQMYFPRTIDGSLSKNIDIFNLWKTMVKTRDSGLNSQPYRFSGVMMPVCDGGVISAPTIFQTIHEWIENHDKITISCYGQCADGVYVIKQFGTHSMRSPDYYRYDLILEKVS